jgi:hypothetical protein
MQNNSHYIAALIKRQWIRDTYVPSDLFTIDVLDEDFVGGYKPMIFTMQSLREILIESLSFIDLPDTPDTYAGFSGQVPIVNPTEDGLMFVDYVDTFLELTDTPIDYTGMAGYGVFVNGAEDGLEFIAPVIPPPEETRLEAKLLFNGQQSPQLIGPALINTLPVTIVWSRESSGTYRATFSAPVDPAKTVAYLMPSDSGVFVPTTYDANYIEFDHTNFQNVGADTNVSNVSVEIKIYP